VDADPDGRLVLNLSERGSSALLAASHDCIDGIAVDDDGLGLMRKMEGGEKFDERVFTLCAWRTRSGKSEGCWHHLCPKVLDCLDSGSLTVIHCTRLFMPFKT